MNPLSLLKLECQRFFPNTTFRVIVILYAVFFVLLWILAHQIGSFSFTSNGQSFNPTRELLLYPQNWQLLAWIGSWLNGSLMGFLGVFMITLEFSNKTLRQSVIFGLSRLDLFMAKAGSALALAAAATFCYVLLGFLGGNESSGIGVLELSLTPYGCVLRFFMQSLGYFFLGTLVGLIIRQTALATLAYLAYTFFLESVGRWLLFFFVTKGQLPLFLPDNVFESLTPFPLPTIMSGVTKPGSFGMPLSSTETLVTALVYLLVFAFYLRRRLSQADL